MWEKWKYPRAEQLLEQWGGATGARKLLADLTAIDEFALAAGARATLNELARTPIVRHGRVPLQVPVGPTE